MTHEDHAAKAIFYELEASKAKQCSNHELATDLMQWAQWHATMALYELQVQRDAR